MLLKSLSSDPPHGHKIAYRNQKRADGASDERFVVEVYRAGGSRNNDPCTAFSAALAWFVGLRDIRNPPSLSDFYRFPQDTLMWWP